MEASPNFHIQSFTTFTVQIVGFGLLGMLLGGAVEKLVTLVSKNEENSLKCTGLLAFELLLNAVVIWFATKLLHKDIFALVSNGWQGRIFLLLFFVAQGSLSRNTQCVFNISYTP